LVKLPEDITQSKCVLGFFEPSHDDMNHLAAKGPRKKASADGPQVGEVLMLDQYVAIADYKKADKGELSVSAGQLVEVIEKNDNGWWFVQIDDGSGKGWVPATFLENAEDGEDESHAEAVPEDGEKYISKQAYKAAEADEVSFPKAAVVTVLEKQLDGWWKVEYQGAEGVAPGAYLQLLDTHNGGKEGDVEEPFSPISKEPPSRRETQIEFGAVAELLATSKISGAPTPPRPPSIVKSNLYITLEEYAAEDDGGVSFPAGATVTLIEKAETGWWCIEYEGQEGWAPADYLEPIQAEVVAVAPARPPTPIGGGAAAAATGPPRPAAPRPAVPTPASAPEPEPAPAAAAVATHKVLTDFFAGSEAEVSVSAGESVTFVEANDGWWFVVKDGGAEGWAPADYFEDFGTEGGGDGGDGGGGDDGAGEADDFNSGDDDDGDEALPAEPAEMWIVEEDFTADAADQISVKRGDELKLIEANEGGWWWMESMDSVAGWVPSDYVVKA
jgi:uncharacterized protein YgiM (DUF1202 family)